MTAEPKHAVWRSYHWQLLRGTPLMPLMHMALDEVLLDEVIAGRRRPTLRMWDWASNAVIIGRFQSLRNEVDLDGTQRHNVRVVRRITGGDAMFVEPGNTITYSVYAPLTLIAGLTTVESYAFLDQWVLDALAGVGVQASYQPINDITSPGGKVAGAAQTRRGNAVLHHVTMANDIDSAKIQEVLRIGREKLSGRGTTSTAKRVDPLRRQTGLSREAIIDHMIATFRDHYGLDDTSIRSEELQAVNRLIETKFGTDA